MESPFADILKTQLTFNPRKLSHEDACGFYAALHDGVAQPIVAKASGLSQGAISHLKAAGEHRGGQLRYPKVAEEYARLGREAFIHKYVSAIIRDRIRVAHDQIVNHRATMTERAGVNPRANKDRGRQVIKDPQGAPDTPIEIKFDYRLKPGWKWRGGETGDAWRGDPRAEESGFAMSSDARAFCQLRFGPSEEQIRSGENEAACDDTWFWSHRQ